MGKFLSTKTYGNDRGLSCCFRQWRSTHSHCSLLHGYSIGIKLIFECESLDERNWVMDFGGLKDFKAWAEHMFDHTLLIAEDDPHLETFKALPEDSMALRVVPAVGCERFAEMAYKKMADIINAQKVTGTALNPTVRVKSVEVFEHGANSAIYEG
jgi:6-pyruvoyltetrahydropterin/6-carboxytetrahydropterin synthase